MEAADFSGYATKANLRCSDGRMIMPNAFEHMDGLKVPLLWQHGHHDPTNVLGYVKLEAKHGDMYCHAFFNKNKKSQDTKVLVQHGDIDSLSIYANRLVEKNKNVSHGQIREVSLVLSGANSGAKIEHVTVQHSEDPDDTSILDDEAIIFTGLTLEHTDGEPEEETEEKVDVVTEEPPADKADEVKPEDEIEEDPSEEEKLAHAEKSVMDVVNSMTDEQRDVTFYMVGKALQGEAAEHSDMETFIEHADDAMKVVFDAFTEEQKIAVNYMLDKASKDSKTVEHSDTDDKEGSDMPHNVFEDNEKKVNENTLSHADQKNLFESARSRNTTLREVVEDYALKHGIEDIDTLFPDAKAVTATPDFLKRRTEWVNEVMTGTRHTPFSRIKSLMADLTLDEARAKGYVKGNLKKEEFFKVSKRVTTPQTVYKKQKLDRDDIVDITDFDVVAWLKGEMRLMLEEEIARAILLGDGRSSGDDDKIKEDHVRPIATDNDLYVTYVYVNLGDANSSHEEIVDALTLQRRHYRGSGNPTFFTSETVLARMLMVKDTLGRRIYGDVASLAAVLRVSKIVTVEVMDEPNMDVIGIMVNLQDYTVGADRGGDVALFDDFDIDYNQYKYLIETRISGALTRPKSALVVKKVAAAAVLRTPVEPTWNAGAHSVTVATTTGVVYKNKLTNATLVTGTPIVLAEGDELLVVALPASGTDYLASSAEDEWFYTYEDGLAGRPM